MGKILIVFIVVFVIFEVVVFLSASPASKIQKIRYDGAQLWNVNLTNENTQKILSDLEESLDLSICSHTKNEASVFVKKEAIDRVQMTFESNNISYTFLIKDMQKLIDERDAANKPTILRSHSFGNPIDWHAYYRLNDIFSYLDYIVDKYPKLCSLQTIGYTHEKRPLKLLRISNGNQKNKAIWIDGGIHAREWISPATVTYIVNDLLENWEKQPEYIKNINFYVLPVLTPDGYGYSHETDRLWRKNRRPNPDSECDGVDLNRNFGYKWGGKGTSSDPCQEIYRGTKGFSELESKALKKFIGNSKEKFYSYLTCHSYGQHILYPWGYDEVLTVDNRDLDRIAREAASKMKRIDNRTYKYGNSAILLYPAAGGSDDWGKSIGIKYSYTIELRDNGKYGFELVVITVCQRIGLNLVDRAFAYIYREGIYGIYRRMHGLLDSIQFVGIL